MSEEPIKSTIAQFRWNNSKNFYCIRKNACERTFSNTFYGTWNNQIILLIICFTECMCSDESLYNKTGARDFL